MCLVLIVGIAAGARLYKLDLMEFKDDEAMLYDLALRHARGQAFMLRGLPSSFGGHESPLNVYLFALPCLLRENPVFVAGCVAALNAVGILFAYFIGRELGGVAAGLAAGLLFSASPWAVTYSRKIWPISLLPFCGSLGLWCFVRLCRTGRVRYVLALGALLSAMTQIHYSAAPLILIAPASVIMAARTRRRELMRRWLLGGALFVALFVPFMLGEARVGFVDIRQLARGYACVQRPPAPLRDKLMSATYALGMLSRAGFAYNLVLPIRRGDRVRLEGDANEFYKRVRSFPSGMAAGFILFGWGVIVALRRGRGEPILFSPVIWLMLIPLASLALPKRVHPHYFALTFPSQFVLAGLGASDLTRLLRRRIFVGRMIVAVFIGWATLDSLAFYGQFMAFIEKHGGSTGEYGICYRWKRALADDMARLAGNAPVTVEDFSHPIACPLAFRVLLKRRGIRAVDRVADADSTFVITNAHRERIVLPSEWRKNLAAQTDHPPLRLYQFKGLAQSGGQ